MPNTTIQLVCGQTISKNVLLLMFLFVLYQHLSTYEDRFVNGSWTTLYL